MDEKNSGNNSTISGIGKGANTTALTLFLIMLAFFIFYVTLSKPESNKKNSLLSSVEKTFGGLSMAQRKTDSVKNLQDDIKEQIDFSSIIAGDSELAKFADVRVEYEYTALVIPADFFFSTGTAETKKQAQDTLVKIAGLIRHGGYLAEIKGYPADSGPESAKASAMKALAILKNISEKGNIPYKRLTSYAWTGKRIIEGVKTDISGKPVELIEIAFYSGGPIEEEDSFQFKNFIFKILE